MSKKEITKILRALEQQGWRIQRGSKHYKAYPPNKNIPPVTIPSTPGGGRWRQNLISQLRRAGADL